MLWQLLIVMYVAGAILSVSNVFSAECHNRVARLVVSVDSDFQRVVDRSIARSMEFVISTNGLQGLIARFEMRYLLGSFDSEVFGCFIPMTDFLCGCADRWRIWQDRCGAKIY